MDGHRFDLVGTWLARHHGRCTTRRGLVAGALAIGLGRLSPEEAAAACKQDGQKCGKDKECCSKKCKGQKCRCKSLRETCTGTTGTADNTCCGSLFCSTNGCGEQKRCCKPLGDTCQSNCDCCIDGAQCQGGECCLGEGANCLFVGSAGCCGGLICNTKAGSTCQPFVLNP